MLFNPVSRIRGHVQPQESFPSSGPAGLVTIPSCDPLIKDLEKGTPLPVMGSREEVTRLLRETVSGIFEFTPDFTASWQEKTVTVTLHDYRFIDGCQLVARESPRCCSLHPCAACSLCGVLIARGLDTVVSLDQCSPDISTNDVTAVFSLLQAADSHP
jgi:hypothetical protein